MNNGSTKAQNLLDMAIKGGHGSGNWGHTGRPGKRGGSGTGGGMGSRRGGVNYRIAKRKRENDTTTSDLSDEKRKGSRAKLKLKRMEAELVGLKREVSEKSKGLIPLYKKYDRARSESSKLAASKAIRDYEDNVLHPLRSKYHDLRDKADALQELEKIGGIDSHTYKQHLKVALRHVQPTDVVNPLNLLPYEAKQLSRRLILEKRAGNGLSPVLEKVHEYTRKILKEDYLTRKVNNTIRYTNPSMSGEQFKPDDDYNRGVKNTKFKKMDYQDGLVETDGFTKDGKLYAEKSYGGYAISNAAGIRVGDARTKKAANFAMNILGKVAGIEKLTPDDFKEPTKDMLVKAANIRQAHTAMHVYGNQQGFSSEDFTFPQFPTFGGINTPRLQSTGGSDLYEVRNGEVHIKYSSW